MTRDEALTEWIVPAIRRTWNEKKCDEILKALDQEPCDDCIRRSDIGLTDFEMVMCNGDYKEALKMLLDKIEKAPSVTPAEKMGRWMRKTKVDGVYDIAGVKTWGVKCQCDRCDFTTTVIEDFGYYKYCPNCGAKMQEVES